MASLLLWSVQSDTNDINKPERVSWSLFDIEPLFTKSDWSDINAGLGIKVCKSIYSDQSTLRIGVECLLIRCAGWKSVKTYIFN